MTPPPASWSTCETVRDEISHDAGVSGQDVSRSKLLRPRFVRNQNFRVYGGQSRSMF